MTQNNRDEKQNEPQLSAEMEAEFDKWFNLGTKKEPRFAYASPVYQEVKNFLATALEEQRKAVIEEVLELLVDEELQELEKWEGENLRIKVRNHYRFELKAKLEAMKEKE